MSDPLARDLSRSPQPNEDRPTRPKPPQSPTIAALQVAFNAGNPAAAAAAAAQNAADRERDDSGLSGSLPVILPPALVSASGAFDAADASNVSALNARRTPSGRMSAPGDLPGSSNRDAAIRHTDTQAARYGAAATMAARQRSQRYEDSSGIVSREALNALTAGSMESPAGSPPLGGGSTAGPPRMYVPGLAVTTGRDAPPYGIGPPAAYGDGGGRYPGVAIAVEQRPLPPVPHSPLQGHGGPGGDAPGMYDTRGSSFRSLRHSATALAEEVIAGGGGAGGAGAGRAPPYMFYNINGVMPAAMGSAYPISGDLGQGIPVQSYFNGPGGSGPPDGAMWGDQQQLFIPGPGGPYGGGSEVIPGGADMSSRRPSYVGAYDYPVMRSTGTSFYGEGDMGDGDGTGGVRSEREYDGVKVKGKSVKGTVSGV